MQRRLAVVLCLASAPAWAQTHHHLYHNWRPPAAQAPAKPAPSPSPTAAATPAAAMPMTHEAAASGSAPTQAGQAAFAAIQEVVALLQADPNTDWSKVDVDALRQHLVDMDHVTIFARVNSVAIADGYRFDATGVGAVRDSIRRMLAAHAATMNGAGEWRYEFADIDNGAALTVHAPAADRAKLKGLGLFGVLTLGMHHQMHHLMIARGMSPHK